KHSARRSARGTSSSICDQDWPPSSCPCRSIYARTSCPAPPAARLSRHGSVRRSLINSGRHSDKKPTINNRENKNEKNRIDDQFGRGRAVTRRNCASGGQ